MNLVVLVGNLTRDPEVRYTQNGLAVAHLNVAVNRTFKKDGGPDSDFFRVTAFGKQAELAERYLSKGKKVGIEGRIQNDNYDKDGQTVYRDTIVVNNIEFLSPRHSGDEPFRSGFDGQDNNAFGRAPGTAPTQASAPAQPAQAAPVQPEATQTAQAAPQGAGTVPAGFSALEDDEDDLPF
jgi:single-strand DNA-binding protein